MRVHGLTTSMTLKNAGQHVAETMSACGLRPFVTRRSIPEHQDSKATTSEHQDLKATTSEHQDSKATTSKHQDSKATDKQVQILLNQLGYNAGPADGIMGSKTQAAIRQFQKDHGLATSGRVSENLLKRLEKPNLLPDHQSILEAHKSEYVRQITEKVERNWLRPKSIPNGLEVKLQLSQIPGGTVIGVSVLKSSGNIFFDNSIVAAVRRASPLPPPKDARLFQREVLLHFKPNS